MSQPSNQTSLDQERKINIKEMYCIDRIKQMKQAQQDRRQALHQMLIID